MKLIGSEEFFKRVGKIRKKEMLWTYAYLIVSVGCIYKTIQHANVCGRASIIEEIFPLGKDEEEEVRIEE